MSTPRNNSAFPSCALVLAAVLLLVSTTARAQFPTNQIKNAFGNRIEAITIFGGDYGVAGASFARGSDHNLSVAKFGGSGDIGDPKPVGNLPIGWQPRLQGNMGYLTLKNKFDTGPLTGDESKNHTFAIQFGGGGRFWFSDRLSFAPTFMGMYGHTENEYMANSAFWSTNSFASAKAAGLVDWSVDTWTIRPALNGQYIWPIGRTLVTFSSDYAFFHTESFKSSAVAGVDGNSDTWQNKVDVDIPLGIQLFGHELRTGGFVSRTEFYDDINSGLKLDHLYEFHGRVVLDYLGNLWKVQWIGLGVSYLKGNSGADGWSIGADIAFRF